MKRFQNILVALDPRFDTHPALEWAIRLAERKEADISTGGEYLSIINGTGI